MPNPHSSVGRSTGLTLAASRPIRMVIGAVVFAIATAVSAKVQVILPGTPVPFTFQPLVVLLAGALLGSRLGAASQVLYLAAGAIGIPAFAFGGGAAYLLGPTGGYLLAYPLAAAMVGWLAAPAFLRTVGAMLAGLGIIYAGGVSWLAALYGGGAVLAMGLLPFVLADLVKVVVGAAVAKRLHAGSRSLFGAE